MTGFRTIENDRLVDGEKLDNLPSDVTAELLLKEDKTNKGIAGGYASLDGGGKIPSAQLPAYVDDVVEVADYVSLPVSGETGKIYVTIDTNLSYRWSGTAYIQIVSDVGIWEGPYNNGTNYDISDKVEYLGSSYIATVAGVGNLPTNNAFWDLLASKGDEGVQGLQGGTGASITSGAFVGNDIVFTKDDLSTVTIVDGKTDLTGVTGNGISSITLISTVGLIKTYRITFTDTTTFDFTTTDGAVGAAGTNGAAGVNAYVYIAYASDNLGTGFTNTFNASLDYIAIKNTATVIASPVVGDFVGLWKNYKGSAGATGSAGSTGATGPQGPVGMNWRGAFNASNGINQTSHNGSYTVGSTRYIGQTFTPSSNIDISTVSIKCEIDTVYNLTVNIFATDGSGLPIGTSLGSNTQASNTDVTFTFGTPISLTGSVKYAFVISSDGPTTSSDYIRFQNTNIYAGGNAVASSNSGVSYTGSLIDDLYFIISSTAGNYAVDDGVSYLGSSYINIQADATGILPTNTAYWDLIASKGTDGTGAGDMLKSENLSGLANYATARTNLGLDTTANQTDSLDKRFMTDAQETKLDGIDMSTKLDKALTNLASIDLNTITDNGFYCANSTCTNLPESGVKTRLRVNKDPSNANLSMQEALTTTTLVSYVRTTANAGTSWTAWARIKATDETKVGLTGNATINGNIGIGTTNLNNKLSITNASIITDWVTDDGKNNLLLQYSDAVNNYRLGFGVYVGGAIIQAGQKSVGATNILLNPKGGSIGIGVTSPTATLHLKAGTATANTAPLKFTAGTNLTTPEAGVIEFDGTNYYITIGTTRYTLSGSNTGDNATNTQYSGLATSKQDTLVSGTNIKTVNGTSLLGSGNVVTATISGTETLTNKRVTKRVVATTQSATPAINTDNGDVFNITGLAQAITSFTTNLTGTPVDGDLMIINITDNGTSRAITWGASFEASTVALPTTTVISALLKVGFMWNAVTSKWRCVATC